MDRGRVAQAILTIALPKDKAIASVGDLLEQVPQNGAAWFWRSVASMLLRRVWRPVAAWPIATFVGLEIWSFLNRSATAAHPSYALDAALTQVAWLLAISTVWCLLQYGWRDASARASALWAVAVTVGVS